MPTKIVPSAKAEKMGMERKDHNGLHMKQAIPNNLILSTAIPNDPVRCGEPSGRIRRSP